MKYFLKKSFLGITFIFCVFNSFFKLFAGDKLNPCNFSHGILKISANGYNAFPFEKDSDFKIFLNQCIGLFGGPYPADPYVGLILNSDSDTANANKDKAEERFFILFPE